MPERMGVSDEEHVCAPTKRRSLWLRVREQDRPSRVTLKSLGWRDLANMMISKNEGTRHELKRLARRTF